MDKHLLELYSDHLLSSFGATTATGLSALVDGAVSHDQVTRFLSGADYDGQTLWQQVKPLIRDLQQADGVLIVDDTIQQKPHTDENALICWQYDHSQNRSVKGINLLHCVYHADGVSLPVTLDFPVLLLRQVFTNQDGSTGTLYLACSDLPCEGPTVEAIYQKRWNVETFHKTLKSHAALAKAPTRRVRTQSNPCFMALYAAARLEGLRSKHRLKHFALRARLYLKAIRSAFEELQTLKTA